MKSFKYWMYFVMTLSVLSLIANAKIIRTDEDEFVFMNRIAIGTKTPEVVAQRYNLQILGRIIPDLDIYEMESINYPKISRKPNVDLKHQVDLMNQDVEITDAKLQIGRMREKKSYDIQFSDPLWNESWHLNPKIFKNDPEGAKNGEMGIMDAWVEGMTGKGVRVAHTDDGIDYNHPDLRYNYDSSISTNIYDNTNDPFESSKANNHGTNMAGLVAAAANNSRCSVGIAHESRIGMIKVNYSDRWSDATEARMFSHARDKVDVYVNGWGPTKGHFDIVGPLAKRALREGTIKGRGGKGNVFVFPAGNEGAYGSGCDYNGYANSIQTITVNGAGQTGSKPYFGLKCSAVLTTTFTGGNYPAKDIVTTDVGGQCRKNFGGTSASVSIAGGVLALAIQANPNLTWRDMQHLVVLSSKTSALNSNDANWITNGANKKFSTSFGFGLLHAGLLVKRAKKWNGIGKQQSCTWTYSNKLNKEARNVIDKYLNENYRVRFNPSSCKVQVLEHVVVTLTASARKRGDVKIHLNSPMGTNLTIFDGYRGDNSFQGFNNAEFLSVGTWGENPTGGAWNLQFQTKRPVKDSKKSFNLSSLKITIFGTEERQSSPK